MKVNISDLHDAPKIEKSPLRLAIQQTLRRERAAAQAEVTLALVDDEAIKNLNLSYRGQDKPTDVLSFAMEESEHPELKDYLGDIVISIETADRQAKKRRHSLEQELQFLAIHGTLHLLGFNDELPDDRRRMMKEQDAILKSLQSTDSTPATEEAEKEEAEAEEEPSVSSAPKRSRNYRRRSSRRKQVSDAGKETDKQL